MKRTNPIIALLAVLLLGLAFAACGDDESSSSGGGSGSSGSDSASGNEIQKVDGAESKPVTTVGSKNFTEQYVLGEIYAQALEAAGYKVSTDLNLGSETVALAALKKGEISGYPEYASTALTSFFGVDPEKVPGNAQEAYNQANADFQKEGLVAFPPTPFASCLLYTSPSPRDS